MAMVTLSLPLPPYMSQEKKQGEREATRVSTVFMFRIRRTERKKRRTRRRRERKGEMRKKGVKVVMSSALLSFFHSLCPLLNINRRPSTLPHPTVLLPLLLFPLLLLLLPPRLDVPYDNTTQQINVRCPRIRPN